MTTTSVIKIKIILILRHTMYYTVTMYSTHYKSSCGSFDECKQRHTAADPQTKPTDLGHESACRLLESTPTITTVLNRKLILTLMYTEGVPKVRVAFTSRRTWSLRDLMSHTEITAKALTVSAICTTTTNANNYTELQQEENVQIKCKNKTKSINVCTGNKYFSYKYCDKHALLLLTMMMVMTMH